MSLLPTAAQPLTPSFPSTAGFPSLQKVYDSTDENTHLVTPRLLLSLLATATYLGHQYLLREALAIVLRTVGPTSVSRYLNFAIGVGIGDEEWDGQDDVGARGMEAVARHIAVDHDDYEDWRVEDEQGHHTLDSQRTHRESTDSAMSSDDAKVGGDASHTSPSRSGSMRSNATAKSDSRTLRIVSEADPAPVFHFYGFVSNKIGEACVCWLTRWGLDILNIEAAEHEEMPGTRDHPSVWGQGGIPAKLAASILSSDALFVPNEMERYTMARRVLDLRRAAWSAIVEEDALTSSNVLVAEPEGLEAWDEDEAELAKVFADGIYYSHMVSIEHDDRTD